MYLCIAVILDKQVAQVHIRPSSSLHAFHFTWLTRGYMELSLRELIPHFFYYLIVLQT